MTEARLKQEDLELETSFSCIESTKVILETLDRARGREPETPGDAWELDTLKGSTGPSESPLMENKVTGN